MIVKNSDNHSNDGMMLLLAKVISENMDYSIKSHTAYCKQLCFIDNKVPWPVSADLRL